mmetsp:Transcript_20693/g.57185  ORF Transcript_20693/g.57185 Transcript_20693/m.57185 type:complete len:323 (-) Transcript_20693:1117-2085(-)
MRYQSTKNWKLQCRSPNHHANLSQNSGNNRKSFQNCRVAKANRQISLVIHKVGAVLASNSSRMDHLGIDNRHHKRRRASKHQVCVHHGKLIVPFGLCQSIANRIVFGALSNHGVCQSKRILQEERNRLGNHMHHIERNFQHCMNCSGIRAAIQGMPRCCFLHLRSPSTSFLELFDGMEHSQVAGDRIKAAETDNARSISLGQFATLFSHLHCPRHFSRNIKIVTTGFAASLHDVAAILHVRPCETNHNSGPRCHGTQLFHFGTLRDKRIKFHASVGRATLDNHQILHLRRQLVHHCRNFARVSTGQSYFQSARQVNTDLHDV